jgi:MFS transporter, FHS family, glucose/mannose:H+ symporter
MASPPTLSLSANPRREWAILHSSFILIGIITTLLGPILPSFSHRWSLTDAEAGFFFAAQYFGSTLGVLLTSIVLPRFGFARVSAAGFAAFFLGFAFLGVGPWYISALMVGINGFGYGLTNPAINLRGTQLPSKNTAAAVTLLNASWSIGSVLCPFLVGGLIPVVHLRGFSSLIALGAFVLILFHLSLRAGERTERPTRVIHPWKDWMAHLRVAQAVPLLLMFFFYVGVEVALGGWVASYEKRLPGMSAVTLAVAPSVFYGALLLGRVVAPVALQRMRQIVISVTGLSLAAVGGAIIAFSNTPGILYLGSAIAGFGLAPQYPILVTWLAAIFKRDSTWIGGLFFGVVGLGGGAIPWLVGIASARTNSLRAGLIIPLVVTFLMIFVVQRARPDREPSATS